MKVTDEMVEIVARAISQADEQNGGPPYDMRIQNKHSREVLFDEAKAAITTMLSHGEPQPNGPVEALAEIDRHIDAAKRMANAPCYKGSFPAHLVIQTLQELRDAVASALKAGEPARVREELKTLIRDTTGTKVSYTDLA